MKEDIYFYTTSMQLAEFLCFKGCGIVGVTPMGRKGSNYKQCVFMNTPRIRELADIYKFGRPDDPLLTVQVREFQEAQRGLELLKRAKNTL